VICKFDNILVRWLEVGRQKTEVEKRLSVNHLDKSVSKLKIHRKY